MVHINRVTKVVKGGKNFSFSALVVVGDGNGWVGYGVGKAREVPSAISKGVDQAKRNLVRMPMQGNHDPAPDHGTIRRRRRAAQAGLPGTGVIAGGPVRAVLESAGVQDILTKSLGTKNPHNVIRATLVGLTSLKEAESVAKIRGKSPEEIQEEMRQ